MANYDQREIGEKVFDAQGMYLPFHALKPKKLVHKGLRKYVLRAQWGSPLYHTHNKVLKLNGPDIQNRCMKPWQNVGLTESKNDVYVYVKH